MNEIERTEIKQKYNFSQHKTLKQPRNVLAVLANHSLYPLFARQAISCEYRLWLAKQLKHFTGVFAFSFFGSSKMFHFSLFQFCGQLRPVYGFKFWGVKLYSLTHWR